MWSLINYEDPVHIEPIFWMAERGLLSSMSAEQVTSARSLVALMFGTRCLNSPVAALNASVADAEAVNKHIEHIASTRAYYLEL